jgi:hypothetical protein
MSQEQTRYQYHTDPHFAERIDEMVAMAVPPERDGHMDPLKATLARDLFLYGFFMVCRGVNPGEYHPLDAFDFVVDNNGFATWTNEPPPGWDKDSEPVLRPEDFRIFELETALAPPYRATKGGALHGTEPWLAEWVKAETKLLEF